MNIDPLPNELVYAGGPIKKIGPVKYAQSVQYAETIGGGVVDLFFGNITETGPEWFVTCVVPASTVEKVWCGSHLLPPEWRLPGTPLLVGPLHWYPGNVPRTLGAWIVEEQSIGRGVRVRPNGTGEVAENQTGARYFLPSIKLHDGSIASIGAKVQFTRAAREPRLMARSVCRANIKKKGALLYV